MATENGSTGLPNTQVSRRVYVVDDDSDVRKSLFFLLSASSITVRPFSSAEDFIAQLPDLAPAPILLDVRMAGMDGLQMLAELEERSVRWPVIVMTAHGEVALAVRAMRLGAIEFLEKPFSPDVLDRALDYAFGVLDQLEVSLHDRDRARGMIDRLSGREREILDILAEGASNKLVAYRLGLSIRTVEMHRGNALAKMNIRTVAEYLALAHIACSEPGSGPTPIKR